MSVYAIVRVDVTDESRYARYAALASEAVADFGGEFIVRGGEMRLMEGSARERNVVIRLPDMQTAERFYHSPKYQSALAFAASASERDYIFVEGV